MHKNLINNNEKRSADIEYTKLLEIITEATNYSSSIHERTLVNNEGNNELSTFIKYTKPSPKKRNQRTVVLDAQKPTYR